MRQRARAAPGNSRGTRREGFSEARGGADRKASPKGSRQPLAPPGASSLLRMRTGPQDAPASLNDRAGDACAPFAAHSCRTLTTSDRNAQAANPPRVCAPARCDKTRDPENRLLRFFFPRALGKHPERRHAGRRSPSCARSGPLQPRGVTGCAASRQNRRRGAGAASAQRRTRR